MVFGLAIIGMICWGIAPIFVKLGLKNINPLLGLGIRTILTLGMIACLMVMNGSITQFKTISLATYILLAFEAVFATVLGDLAYFAAVKRGSVSVVTIIMSSSPLVTILCAVIFLGEKVTMVRFAGACLVILGIVLVV